MIDYHDRTALVTGAGSGIGAALAKALATRGARVLCADVAAEAAQEIAAEIGASAVALACDLADPASSEALLEEAWEVTGKIDLICSNAGIGESRSVAETRFDEGMDRLFEINFFAGMKLAQGYARRLEEAGERGCLIVTASENSLSLPSAVKAGQMAFYGATKHALLIAMEWLRIEQEEGPLDLHVLLPGAVYTPLVSRMLPDPALAPPELELIMPEQCAEIALRGIDLNLFYIPTQAHLLEDMRPRLQHIEASLQALGVSLTY
jgi:NAD(P)-dependent dehydrogenase (short-subunit alcohol dehydrogenase family)